LTAYLDASALAKLLLADEGDRAELLAVLDAAGTIATSRLTYVETRAAIAGARRSGRMSAGSHDVAVAEFEAVWQTLTVVDLTQAIAEDAGLVAETFGLRAGDAIQFASLRYLSAGDVPMIAWDARLRAAVLASGYACYPLTV
jgi:uncharacterized protein